MIQLTHKFVSPIQDGSDTSLVRPSNWNDNHSLVIAGQSILGNNNAGSGPAIELSASQVLDLVGSVQGDILYRSAAGWQVLAPGTSGQILQTGGAGANPAWGNVTVDILAGTGISITGSNPATISLAAISNNTFLANSSGSSAAPIATSLGATLLFLSGALQTVGMTGDVTTSANSFATSLKNIPNDATMAGDILATNIVAPGTPAAGKTRIYVDSTRQVLSALNSTGTSITVFPSSAGSHQWANGISVAGVISYAQPAYSDISGSIPNDTACAGDLLFTNIAAPATPASGKTRVWTDSTNKVLSAINDAGTVSNTVVPNAGSAHNFVTAISAAGVISLAQPAFSDISGSLPNSQMATMANNTIKSNISGGTAVPSDNTLTAILDNILGSTQGDIIYRGASSWGVLAPGTAGQVLQTNGAGANPSWVTSPPGIPIGGYFQALSATQVSYSAYNGDIVQINGVLYPIPTGSGVIATYNSCYVGGVAAQTLAASTTYLVYVFNNSGTLTLDFYTPSTHNPSSTAGNVGVEIRNGDDTRTLVGMVFTDGSGKFQDTGNVRGTISWFNRRVKVAGVGYGNLSTSSVSNTWLSGTGIMCCNWGTDTPQVFATAQTESTVGAPAGGGYAFFGIYVDNLSTLAGLGNYSYASVPAPTTVGGPVQIAEGAHTYVPVGSATSGSGIMYAFNTDVFVQVMG